MDFRVSKNGALRLENILGHLSCNESMELGVFMVMHILICRLPIFGISYLISSFPRSSKHDGALVRVIYPFGSNWLGEPIDINFDSFISINTVTQQLYTLQNLLSSE